jgi:hypothetical protein
LPIFCEICSKKYLLMNKQLNSRDSYTIHSFYILYTKKVEIDSFLRPGFGSDLKGAESTRSESATLQLIV